ncbi:hypothetical protein BLD25_01530 [Candidatus Gracilibacteria bacterium GN02-872]|nr:hypothetical protein BLD25_01530 [Candidatus Gracilibacteria bacterium GN02-872]
MQRFYFENIKNYFFIEDKNFINQVLKVLRSQLGDKFIFFDGKKCTDFVFEISEIQKNKIFFKKLEEIDKNSEIDFEINLFSSIPNKLEKIEFIAQKGTEVGVSNFYFFKSQRSQKIFLNENKVERIKKIIQEASEQSNRNKIPNFQIIEKIDFEKLKKEKNIFLHTKDENSIKLSEIKAKSGEKINIFIGPEGGFSDEEIEIFQKNNFQKIFLGNRILRTETVGFTVAFFIIQNF